jgi:hypothetical protein
MHDKEYYERLVYEKAKKYAAKTTICIMTGVTDATMPNIVRGGGCGESTGRGVLERIKLPRTIA